LLSGDRRSTIGVYHSSGQCTLRAYVVWRYPGDSYRTGRSGHGRGSARSDRDRGSFGGPPHVTYGERKVIVILTNPTLIDRISTDSRRIEILQDYIATVSTRKIVATGARHSFFCKKN